MQAVLEEYYTGERFIKVIPYPADDYLEKRVHDFYRFVTAPIIWKYSFFGNEERILLSARFDNLGKGASGAAVQNMNLVLGVDEATGL